MTKEEQQAYEKMLKEEREEWFAEQTREIERERGKRQEEWREIMKEYEQLGSLLCLSVGANILSIISLVIGLLKW